MRCLLLVCVLFAAGIVGEFEHIELKKIQSKNNNINFSGKK